ncbi:hypothetical protein B0T20DRAFT_478918 [Sordaria brevicollis]|uniref:Uncharacterized protein n=1 Tax=Sordaria brevicollis TaxID=83679 RepID=A0AAE0PDT7_SORBR|nr:hypothetical protein B0T20DRAFT_478918 [Sordaria brevicollis]
MYTRPRQPPPKEPPPKPTLPIRTPGGTPCGVPAGEKTIFVLADPHDPIDRCYLAISYDVSDGKTPQISDPTNDDYRWIVYEYIDPALTVFKLANPYAYHMGLKAEDERWAPPTDVTTRVITQKWQVQFEREISSFPSAKFTGHIKGVIDYYVMCEPPVVLTKRGFVEALVERIKRDGLPLFPDEHGFASSSLLENSGGKKLDELFGPPLEVPEGYKRLKQNQGEAQRQRNTLEPSRQRDRSSTLHHVPSNFSPFLRPPPALFPSPPQNIGRTTFWPWTTGASARRPAEAPREP